MMRFKNKTSEVVTITSLISGLLVTLFLLISHMMDWIDKDIPSYIIAGIVVSVAVYLWLWNQYLRDE